MNFICIGKNTHSASFNTKWQMVKSIILPKVIVFHRGDSCHVYQTENVDDLVCNLFAFTRTTILQAYTLTENLWRNGVFNSEIIVMFVWQKRCIHTRVGGHRLMSGDIVARVETMSTFVHRRRSMNNDASMVTPTCKVWKTMLANVLHFTSITI